jgi:nucleoside-diphosphate-sugar epimerase
MNANKSLLLTGATGFIGNQLLHHFRAQGWKVVALVRREPGKRTPGVVYQHFDLTSPRLNSDIFKEIDVFIHAAYVKARKSLDAFSVNLQGSQQLHDAAAHAEVKQNIFISSLAARDDAVSEYGRQKFAIEKIFSGANDTVVRPGLVLGEGGLFANMRKYIIEGRRIPLIDAGTQPLQTLHVVDLISVIDKIVAERIIGLYIVAEPEPIPYRVFYEELCRNLGLEPRFKHMPYWFLNAVLRGAETVGIELVVNSDNLRGLKTMNAVESKKSLEELGVSVRNYRESLHDLVEGSGSVLEFGCSE